MYLLFQNTNINDAKLSMAYLETGIYRIFLFKNWTSKYDIYQKF